MLFAHPPTLLPSTEYHRLQRLLRTMIGSRTPLASVLRLKLGAAAPALAQTVPDDVALSGARVRFRTDRQRPEERVLTWQAPERGDDIHLSLRSPRGLALLGLSPGESVSYRTDRDRTEYLEVERVSQAA